MRGTTRTKSARVRTVTARVDDEVEGVSSKVARVNYKIAKRETDSAREKIKENGLWECLRLREPIAFESDYVHSTRLPDLSQTRILSTKSRNPLMRAETLGKEVFFSNTKSLKPSHQLQREQEKCLETSLDHSSECQISHASAAIWFHVSQRPKQVIAIQCLGNSREEGVGVQVSWWMMEFNAQHEQSFVSALFRCWGSMNNNKYISLVLSHLSYLQ